MVIFRWCQKTVVILLKIKIMAEKCAIYVRVSSDIQDYDRQITDLQRYAKENDFEIPNDALFEDKLSGFKDETQREGLKNLLSYIVNGSIKNVLVWELSRLARKQLHLLRLAEFFEQNKINVRFYKQGFWLLDDNFRISGQAGMSMAVMGWYSEYESRLMKDRFISQKKLNESLGKYNGGKIPFGYKLDENNKYIINEDKINGLDVSEADIVREVFALYEKGLVCSKICRVCRSKSYPKIVANTHTLARLLRNTSYIGFKNGKLGKRPTPAIITEPQYYTVNKLIEQNKTKADKGKKHVFLLRGLIKCAKCNAYYVGKQTDDGYICPKNSGSNKTNKDTSCLGGNVSISNIDGIMWSRTKYWLRLWKVQGFDDEKLEFKTKIENLNQQINRYQNLIQSMEKERHKINFMFQNDGCTRTEYQKSIAKNRGEKEKYQQEIALLVSEITLYERKKEESLSFNQRIENINAIQDRTLMKTIMKALIREITFFKVDLFKTVVIVKYYRTNTTECILYNSVSKKGNKYRLTYTKYFRYDNPMKIFFAIKEPENIEKYTSTKILKENGIGEELPEYITPSHFVELTKKTGRNDIKMTDLIDYPIPNESNSEALDFNTMMIFPDIEGIITTHEYEKNTYFKDLNKARFNRRR